MKPFLTISAFLATMIAIFALYPVAVSAAEVQMTPDEQRTITAVIQKFGYNCPLAKMTWYEGADAHGFVMKVYCGPAAGDGIYRRAVFRFTRLPDGRVSVEPWDGD